MIVLIFDTETTGLPPKIPINKNKEVLDKWPYIVQLSYIVYDTQKHKLLGTYDWIIKLPPGVEMSTDVIKIHGITNEMSQSKGVDIQLVLTNFINSCKKADLIVAHNISFDLKMIPVEMERQLEYMAYSDFYFTIDTKLYCTMQESIDLCNLVRIDKYGNKHKKFPKLSELHEYLFSVVPINLHNSLNDVVVCLRCFYKLYLDLDILQLDTEINSFATMLNMC